MHTKTACVICGQPGKPLMLSSGEAKEVYCEGWCTGLGWERALLEENNALKGYEARLLDWRWRRRQAEVHNKPFDEEPPKSMAEIVAEAQDITQHIGGVE